MLKEEGISNFATKREMALSLEEIQRFNFVSTNQCVICTFSSGCVYLHE